MDRADEACYVYNELFIGKFATAQSKDLETFKSMLW